MMIGILLALIIAGAIFLFVLLLRPEYVVFLYGLSLGFPDLSFPIVNIINLRVDDVMVLLLFARMLMLGGAWELTSTQKQIILAYFIFFAYCIFSAAVVFFMGSQVDNYVLIRAVGGVFTIFVLAASVRTEYLFRHLIVGMCAAGLALGFQIYQNLGSIAVEAMTQSHELKSAAAFSTWNPNTIGQAGLLLTFSAALGWWYTSSRKFINSLPWFSLTALFSALPLFLFARGATIAVLSGWVIVMILSRKWKLLFIATFLASALFYIWFNVFGDMIATAFDIDLNTGQGLSRRYDMWETSLDLISRSPVLGNGFGQEFVLFSEIVGKGMSHNAYLSILVELGIVGLCMILYILFKCLKFMTYIRSSDGVGIALMSGFVSAIAIESLSSSGLYWEKFPIISMTIISISLRFITNNIEQKTAYDQEC